MLITRKHLLNKQLDDTEIRFLQMYSRHELPWNKTYESMVGKTGLPIDSKDICDISIKEFTMEGRHEFYSHYEIYYAIQTALNLLRVLEGQQIISLAYLARERQTQTAIFKINGKIVLQIDQLFGGFLDPYFAKKKDFWNCITLFHRFIADKELVDLNEGTVLESSRYPETIVRGFPRSNLAIEYALRKEDDSISLEHINDLLKTYKLDDRTLKGIKALING